MRKKEMVAMLLAGGEGSRLGMLTHTNAKPAVAFGGKYKIIDFPMSNCINSGLDTVGILTQYQPLTLTKHIGIGIPWDLDRRNGGVTVLAPHVKGKSGEWYSGTANAIFQNIDYIDSYNPEFILILSGDHIYKMDYSEMLKTHKKRKSDATIAVLEVTLEEATSFGIMNTKDNDVIYEFEEKPAHPKSKLASMGIYIFTWEKLRDALIRDNKIHNDSDFGKHIIPMMLGDGLALHAYRFNDYWKDVGTIESYWRANMELIKVVPDFNLYEDFWKIYTDADHQPPQYTGATASVTSSLLSEGCEIYGSVHHSILGPEVIVEEGAVVIDSIIMESCVIGKNSQVVRCIIDEGTKIGNNVVMGEGDDTINEQYPHIYNTGITVVGSGSVIPDSVRIGKNCAINGNIDISEFDNGKLISGKTIFKKEVIA